MSSKKSVRQSQPELNCIMTKYALGYWNARNLGAPDLSSALGAPADWHQALVAAATMAFLGAMDGEQFSGFVYDLIAEAKARGAIRDIEIELFEEEADFFVSGLRCSGAPSFFPTGIKVSRAVDEACQETEDAQ